MSRPRLKNLEDVETETDRDSPKGVETETETKSLATHCVGPCTMWLPVQYDKVRTIHTRLGEVSPWSFPLELLWLYSTMLG